MGEGRQRQRVHAFVRVCLHSHRQRRVIASPSASYHGLPRCVLVVHHGTKVCCQGSRGRAKTPIRETRCC